MSSCSKIGQTEGISKFHVNVLWKSSNADSLFFPTHPPPHFGTERWIAFAAGVLWDGQRLAPQKEATNILSQSTANRIYLCVFCLTFFFCSKECD